MMDSIDDDIFALSDEDIPTVPPKSNPVEEHLMKKLSDVQNRIEKTNNDIEEIRKITARVLKSLHSQALYGADVTSDSDSDLYTIDGEPVIKRTKCTPPQQRNKVLLIEDTWKRIFCDKCVIGVALCKTSDETLWNPKFYIDVKGESKLRGTSMFWRLEKDKLWYKTDAINVCKIIATVAFDLPKFDRKSFSEVSSTISYELNEKEYQIPVPIIRIRVEDAIDRSFGITLSEEQDYLVLKSTSVEKLVSIQLKGHPGRRTRIMEYLKTRNFTRIQDNVYIIKETGNLMYCLIEMLPMTQGEVEFNIFARSSTQMNLMLGLLRNEFPDISVKEDNNCIVATMALIDELQLYLHDGSTPEKQRARIKTDLLIS